MGPVTVVIAAAAQSVAKVLVIGLVGYVSVLYPQKAPLLPREIVGSISRFTFRALLLPLFYSTVASTVTPESIGNYWFVAVGCFVVVGISYLVATIMQSCIPITNVHDFRALRIAASFPNIVGLPILLFPQLCEFPVIHEGYSIIADNNKRTATSQELEAQCVLQANTMILCYFFVYMFLFWGIGNPQLMQAAKLRANTTINDDKEEAFTTIRTLDQESFYFSPPPEQEESQNRVEEKAKSFGIFYNIWSAIKQTLTSAGFIATTLGFITACILPLQHALFEPEAPLRFLGSAVETLGIASSSISTMVVAASLMSPVKEGDDDSDDDDDVETSPTTTNRNSDDHAYQRKEQNSRPSFSRLRSFRNSVGEGSTRIIKPVARSSPEMRRMYTWFCLSRLVVTPATVVGIILALDCGFDLLGSVPKLALLVLIINSCLPGALIVVVLLKSKVALAETATVVAKVYFLSYILSIFTIAAWTAIGLYVTLPDENGNTVCNRR